MINAYVVPLVLSIAVMSSAASEVGPTIHGGKATTQEVRLFALPEQGGASETFSTKCDDAANCAMDDFFDSACVDGLWIFYTQPGYMGDSEFAYGSNSCFTFLFGADQLSSFRYVGSLLDWMKPAVTLYRDFQFTGQELFKANDGNTVISGNSTWSSLIVTGLTDWTLYSGPDYTGVSICLTDVITLGPGFIDGMENVLGVGTIGSVRQSCFKSK